MTGGVCNNGMAWGGGRRVLVFLSDLRKRERNQDLPGISATKVKCMDTQKTLRARWKECKRKGKIKEIKH